MNEYNVDNMVDSVEISYQVDGMIVSDSPQGG